MLLMRNFRAGARGPSIRHRVRLIAHGEIHEPAANQGEVTQSDVPRQVCNWLYYCAARSVQRQRQVQAAHGTFLQGTYWLWGCEVYLQVCLRVWQFRRHIDHAISPAEERRTNKGQQRGAPQLPGVTGKLVFIRRVDEEDCTYKLQTQMSTLVYQTQVPSNAGALIMPKCLSLRS